MTLLPAKFEVIVGNVGCVRYTDDEQEAKEAFAACVIRSKEGRGRAGNEPVTMMKGGEILAEYAPETEAGE